MKWCKEPTSWSGTALAQHQRVNGSSSEHHLPASHCPDGPALSHTQAEVPRAATSWPWVCEPGPWAQHSRRHSLPGSCKHRVGLTCLTLVLALRLGPEPGDTAICHDRSFWLCPWRSRGFSGEMEVGTPEPPSSLCSFIH